MLRPYVMFDHGPASLLRWLGLPRLAPAIVAGAVAIAPSFGAESSHAAEVGDSPLTVRVASPPPRPWDSTALGRATHRLQITFTNGSKHRVTVAPASLAFSLRRSGVETSCEAPEVERPTQSLAPGATVAIDVAVACETPLPGRYELEVRRGEQPVATAALEIEGGPTQPVRVPWDNRVFAAVNATKEMRPLKDAGVHVALALVNSSGESLRAPPSRAEVEISRRGKRLPACGHAMDLSSADVEPGRSHAFEDEMPCDLSVEGLYDVRVKLASEGGSVRLPTHTLLVAVIPVPHPGPTNRLPPSLTP